VTASSDPKRKFSQLRDSAGVCRNPGFAAPLQGRDDRASLCNKDANDAKRHKTVRTDEKIILQRAIKIPFLWQYCRLMLGIGTVSLWVIPARAVRAPQKNENEDLDEQVRMLP